MTWNSNVCKSEYSKSVESDKIHICMTSVKRRYHVGAKVNENLNIKISAVADYIGNLFYSRSAILGLYLIQKMEYVCGIHKRTQINGS